jgi:hypothetical protein
MFLISFHNPDVPQVDEEFDIFDPPIIPETLPIYTDTDYVCPICDGGPGNNCACACNFGDR